MGIWTAFEQKMWYINNDLRSIPQPPYTKKYLPLEFGLLPPMENDCGFCVGSTMAFCQCVMQKWPVCPAAAHATFNILWMYNKDYFLLNSTIFNIRIKCLTL